MTAFLDFFSNHYCLEYVNPKTLLSFSKEDKINSSSSNNRLRSSCLKKKKTLDRYNYYTFFRDDTHACPCHKEVVETNIPPCHRVRTYLSRSISLTVRPPFSSFMRTTKLSVFGPAGDQINLGLVFNKVTAQWRRWKFLNEKGGMGMINIKHRLFSHWFFYKFIILQIC